MANSNKLLDKQRAADSTAEKLWMVQFSVTNSFLRLGCSETQISWSFKEPDLTKDVPTCGRGGREDL